MQNLASPELHAVHESMDGDGKEHDSNGRHEDHTKADKDRDHMYHQKHEKERGWEDDKKLHKNCS